MDHHHFNSSTCDSKYPFQTCSLFGNAKRFMHGRLHDISLVFLSSPYTLWGLTAKSQKRFIFFLGGKGVPNATKIRITISTWIQMFARVIKKNPVFSRHFSTKNWNHHHNIPTSSSQVWSLEYWGSRLLPVEGRFFVGEAGKMFFMQSMEMNSFGTSWK